MRHILPAVIVLTGFVTLLPGQNTQSMRAQIRGGGGDTGKCTIEVEVDGVADVEVRGDTAFIRTLQGQPSTWRRFECTSVLPRNPADFRFKGIDGRGNVQLIRDPNSSGVAVVRIEDRQGGREGYTFDLEWRGNSFAGNSPYDPNLGNSRRSRDPYNNGRDPYNNGRDPYNNRNEPYRDDRYSRNRSTYGTFSQETVGMCESAVRDQARRDHGARNIRFLGGDVDDLPGARDRVVGAFEGNRGERYVYSCTVNSNNGRIRSVDIRRR